MDPFFLLTAGGGSLAVIIGAFLWKRLSAVESRLAEQMLLNSILEGEKKALEQELEKYRSRTPSGSDASSLLNYGAS